MNTVIIGMMGAGKSAVGRALAELTGREFVDTDEVVESRAGCSVAELWRRAGERAFRALEAEVVADVAVGTGMVVSVGGGAPLRRGSLEALRRSGRLVWLRARPETLRARLGSGNGRPLAAQLEGLAVEREAAYQAAAHVVLDTDDLTVDQVASRLARRVTVWLEEQAYDVVVGAGALSDLTSGGRRTVLIAPRVIIDLVGGRIDADVTLEIPDGEPAKNPQVVVAMWEAMAGSGIGRNDVIVGAGGGAATDVAGFLASTYLRGVPWVALPTSLLGMVDAAIGGKTAIDLAQGKNLVGSFWQPSLVVCDTDFIDTLPERELRSGWGEIVKYGLMADPAILDECMAGAKRPSDALVRRCVEIKAEIISGDERESGMRMWLNYGHTVGHAVELASGMDLSHGEAVAVGLVASAELGHSAGLADVRAHTNDVLDALHLPKRAPGLDRDAVMNAMRSDKKRGSRGLRFVLLEAVGHPVVVDEAVLPEGALTRALDLVLK